MVLLTVAVSAWAEKVAIMPAAITGGEQCFDPGDFSAPGLFWHPSREPINLEMISKAVALAKGQSAHYAYEVRYLKAALRTTPSPKPETQRQPKP